MKHPVVFFLCAVLSAFVWGEDGRSILQQALLESPEKAFSATLHNPIDRKLPEAVILPYGGTWTFHHAPDGKGGLRLRLDIAGKNGITETYVRNENGTYGQTSDGFAAEIIDVPWLWHPTLVYQPVDEKEMELASFSATRTTIDGRPCHKIIMKTPSDAETLKNLTGEASPKFEDNLPRYMAKRVFVREFVIDSRNHFIYSRRHFNRNGKLIFQVNLGDVSFPEEMDDALFATPPQARNLFVERDAFAQHVSRARLEAQSKFRRSPLGPWLISLLSSPVTVGIFGGILLALGVILKWKNRH